MGLVAVTALAVALVIGVPLALVGLTAVGPVGWILAAVVAPLAVLVGLLLAARHRDGDGGAGRR